MLSRKFRQKPKGSILIIVLLVLSGMTIIAVGLAYRERIQIQLTKSQAEKIKAYYLAIGGIQRLKALIASQKLTPERTAQICQFYNSAKNEKLFAQLKNKPNNKSQLSYALKDELSYLNINKSDPAGWENLKTLTKTQIACILDWIDSDNDVNPQGAETDFYKRQNPPYVCKNAPMETLKELVFVKSINGNLEKYLGKNLAALLLQKTQSSKNLRELFDNSRNTPGLGLLNVFTALGDGKININTASANIISTLPGINNQAANNISFHRAGPDGQLGTNDDVFVAEANAISATAFAGVTDLQIELLKQYCCCSSNYFRLYSYAESKNCRCCLLAIIKIVQDKGQIIYLEKLL